MPNHWIKICKTEDLKLVKVENYRQLIEQTETNIFNLNSLYGEDRVICPSLPFLSKIK